MGPHIYIYISQAAVIGNQILKSSVIQKYTKLAVCSTLIWKTVK
jgi:hypothetical protein